MLSTTDAIKQLLLQNPMMENLLAKNLLNLTQLATEWQPKIEDITYKKVTLGSVVTSLSRLRVEIDTIFQSSFKINDISLKFPISEISFVTKPDHVKKIAKLYEDLSTTENHYLNAISGNTETSIFVNTKYSSNVIEVFKNQKLKLNLSNLASVSLKFDESYLETKGITYQVLKALLWENINLVEIVSTYTEITLIIEKKDAQKALQVLSSQFLD